MTKRVTFSHPENGWPEDRELAAQFLIAGNVYTVFKEEIFDWVTYYQLEEFLERGAKFNSVLFEVIE